MSRVLVVVPDYASHYFPIGAVGRSLDERGHRVMIATGPGLQPRVLADGFDHIELVLGPGSNSGLMRPDRQNRDERRQLAEFFEATRKGMVPTLLHQARNRLRDLLWEPEAVAARMRSVLAETEPDAVIVDQLAFGATAALRGLGRQFISFHPGHPSAISVGWPYGYPPRMPSRLAVGWDELEELKRVCQEVVARFTDEYNSAIGAIDPGADKVGDAFAAVSETRTLVNYPGLLGTGYGLPVRTRFIGSSVRKQDLPDDLSARFELKGSRPRIYVSLGSFFSARSDLLRKLVAAFRHEPVELVLASGITPRDELGEPPDHWTVEPYLPQTALIRRSDLVITHGGNNTVTEALTAGVPLLVGPLSTDQFAGAADVETSGLGQVFDPNFDSATTIADIAHDVLAGDSVVRAAELATVLSANPGQEISADLVEASLAEPALG